MSPALYGLPMRSQYWVAPRAALQLKVSTAAGERRAPGRRLDRALGRARYRNEQDEADGSEGTAKGSRHEGPRGGAGIPPRRRQPASAALGGSVAPPERRELPASAGPGHVRRVTPRATE